MFVCFSFLFWWKFFFDESVCCIPFLLQYKVELYLFMYYYYFYIYPIIYFSYLFIYCLNNVFASARFQISPSWLRIYLNKSL